MADTLVRHASFLECSLPAFLSTTTAHTDIPIIRHPPCWLRQVDQFLHTSIHTNLHGASRVCKHGIDRLCLLELDRNPPHNPESAWLDCTAPHYCESTQRQHHWRPRSSSTTSTSPSIPRAHHNTTHQRCPATYSSVCSTTGTRSLNRSHLLGEPTAISPAPGQAVARPTTTSPPATPHSFEPGQHRPPCCALRRLWRSSSS